MLCAYRVPAPKGGAARPGCGAAREPAADVCADPQFRGRAPARNGAENGSILVIVSIRLRYMAKSLMETDALSSLGGEDHRIMFGGAFRLDEHDSSTGPMTGRRSPDADGVSPDPAADLRQPLQAMLLLVSAVERWDQSGSPPRNEIEAALDGMEEAIIRARRILESF